ncbi:MAG: response regulator [bacterium]|nr:response regulator [bacterium]
MRDTLKFTILVVDDDEDFNEAISNRLRTITEEVDVSFFGSEAVQKVYEKDYDLVLLDILLKDTDGVAVFNKIKKMKPYLNIVLMSAFIRKDIVRAARELPSLAFLEKPFEFQKLKDIITALQMGQKK